MEKKEYWQKIERAKREDERSAKKARIDNQGCLIESIYTTQL